MDAGNWISIGGAVVAASSAVVAVSSRKIAGESRDQAVQATHRADAPKIELTCDGKYGNSSGLVVIIESDKDLDSMEVELTDAYVEAKRGGFHGVWVDQIVNSPMGITYGDHGNVTLQNVRAGSPAVVVAQAYTRSIPKEAELKFRLTCTSGKRPPWVIAKGTGPLPIHFSTS